MATFFILNFQGECLSDGNKSSKKTNKTSVSDVCDLFTFTTNNALKHFKTKKCVFSGNGINLNLSWNCDDINSIFQQTPDGQLMHTNSGKCIPAVSIVSGSVLMISTPTGTLLSEVKLGDCDCRCRGLFRMVQGTRKCADFLSIQIFKA